MIGIKSMTSMKKALISLLTAGLLAASLFFSADKPEVIKFEIEEKDVSGFHNIYAAEKVNDGVLYYSGDKVIYDKDGVETEIADEVRQLWRDGDDIYYDSDYVLYTYNLEAKETSKMVKNPGEILGKYDGNIISYSGRTIYSINGKNKTKVFKDGYYLNVAVLHGNKVYGIPATNVYEYNLDTQEVRKVTKNPEHSSVLEINGELYILTEEKHNGKSILSKVNDGRLDYALSIKQSAFGIAQGVRDGMFVLTGSWYDDDVKDNKLLYIHNGNMTEVDRGYSYEIVGIVDGKLCYYKNLYIYGTYDENLTTFYLYDGKESVPAFELAVNYYEDICGYEYDGGIIIEVSYESNTVLYNYDGESLKSIDTPNYFFRLARLEVVDDKAYISYSTGEESFDLCGAIIPLGE